MLKEGKTRSSNIELLRIITMLVIVAHHYVVNSGIGDIVLNNSAINIKNTFYLIIGGWGKTGINCFVLITGYFMCKSRITIRKFLKLVFEVEFETVSSFV